MMWLICALLSATTAALVAILSKLGSAKIDTTTATTLRSVVMTVFLIGVGLVLRKMNFSYLQTIPSKDLTLIALSGVAGALSWLFYFFALKIGHVHNVVAIDRLSVAIAAVLSVLVLGETMSIKEWLGILCMTGGAFLLIP
jgi:transporter family protein